MSRPIEPTPILRNRDADRLFKEAEQEIILTAQKRKELDDCANLWEKFQSLSIGKQKGFEIKIGWFFFKVILLGKKFIVEFSVSN